MAMDPRRRKSVIGRRKRSLDRLIIVVCRIHLMTGTTTGNGALGSPAGQENIVGNGILRILMWRIGASGHLEALQAILVTLDSLGTMTQHRDRIHR